MVEEIYFFDSYAIVEIINGNSNYLPYKEVAIITTKLNLFEVCYSLLREGKQKELDEFLLYSYNYIIDFDQELIKDAAFFRLQHKKRNISMTDCIGYSLAKWLGLKFLTGDKEFEHFDNVEFIK
ncbi:MAG TPA: PIN domain-containing protein [Candidatus Nanoarchaeia archaeon]|nr:PIN domain-containing protein [Candidatus Nanoarchaeia archaeon]